MPKVSIIIPAYNQGHYLAEAIDSAIGQTYPDFEVVVVDDGSIDNTSEVAHSYSDPRIHYVYQENCGLSSARNTGIRSSSGELLTFLDSDDQFLPVKLALLVRELEMRPELGMVAGQAIPIDEQGRQIGIVFDKPLPAEPHELLLGNPLHVGSVILQRNWQNKVGFFDESLRSYEDWDMWLRLAKVGCKMGWVPQPVSLYRFHPEQMTRIGSQMTKATFAVLDKIFADPDLPESWHSKRELAYSNAFLRAAAQAYHAKDFDSACEFLSKAVELNPDLSAQEGLLLAKIITSWIELPKTSDPFGYLERIFDHLPGCVTIMRRYRRQELGRAAIQLAFQAYHRGDYRTTRQAAIHAFRYQPKRLLNRGTISIFLRSCLKAFSSNI